MGYLRFYIGLACLFWSLALSAPLVFAGLSVSPGTPAHTHTDANTGGGDLAVSGTVSSTKACASEYTRMGPNFCAAFSLSSPAGNAWGDAVACTARSPTASTIPADAKAIVIQLNWQALSANAIAIRDNTVEFYSDAACTATSNVEYSRFSVREFAAVAAGTVIGRTSDHVIVPLGATNTFYTKQANAGGNGNADVADYAIYGYFD